MNFRYNQLFFRSLHQENNVNPLAKKELFRKTFTIQLRSKFVSIDFESCKHLNIYRGGWAYYDRFLVHSLL